MIDKLIESDQKEIQVVTFKLGIEEYATLITDVREVIVLQNCTRIPEAPHYVKGVINLRGNIIPVIDGKKRFNLETSEEYDSGEKRIMIMDTKQGTVGLIVDSVTGVVKLKIEDIEPPHLDLGEDKEIFWGVARHMDKLFILMNSQKSLSLDYESYGKEN
ncbi:MAG: hypothetical protein A2Y25_11655 [Candidatus Melainabacteria bacterium GWF2_37_15]|nr:MAG: hypothetical protein A2Y25_11655 [Candidatus Melainabacteria bacterium GWF2_37_15]